MHFLRKFLVCILPRVACSYLQHFILGLLAHSGFERLLNFVLVHSHCCTNHHSPLYHNLEYIFWILPFPNSNVSCSDSEEPEYSPNNWSSLARVLCPEKFIKFITKRYFCLFPKYIYFWESDVDNKIMINTNFACFEREKTFTGALPLLVCRLRCVWFSRIHTKNIFSNEHWNQEKSWYFPTVPIVTQAQKLGCSRRNQFSYELWDVR